MRCIIPEGGNWTCLGACSCLRSAPMCWVWFPRWRGSSFLGGCFLMAVNEVQESKPLTSCLLTSCWPRRVTWSSLTSMRRRKILSVRRYTGGEWKLLNRHLISPGAEKEGHLIFPIIFLIPKTRKAQERGRLCAGRWSSSPSQVLEAPVLGW